MPICESGVTHVTLVGNDVFEMLRRLTVRMLAQLQTLSMNWPITMEWNGLEWNHGVEWSGVDLSGVCMMMECNAVECNGMDRWNAMQWSGMEWMHFGSF